MRKEMSSPVLFGTLFLLPLFTGVAQAQDAQKIAGMVAEYKQDPRGPYKDIRWFCKDGTTRPPQERCPEPGLQRARYKDAVESLGLDHHIFLGQILATTDFGEFWDEGNYHSRMKQYMVEGYLRRTDNGWILRKAQYYRGAIQAEDEENWGLDFFRWLLAEGGRLDKSYFLVREGARDIPHQGDNNKTQTIRALSKEISDSVPAFLDYRVKIHGQPGPGDLQATKEFMARQGNRLSTGQAQKLNTLVLLLEEYYRPVNPGLLSPYLKKVPAGTPLHAALRDLISRYDALNVRERVPLLSDLLLLARTAILAGASPEQRLSMLDLSLALEEILFRESNAWETRTAQEMLEKVHALGRAAAGCGYLELWEWNSLSLELALPASQQMTLGELNDFFINARRLVEWSTAMTRSIFRDAVGLYNSFEPLAGGFFDDRVRSSILLPLGECTSELGELVGLEAGLSNQVMGIRGQSQVRGINPGVALGELVVTDELKPGATVSSDKIYILSQPPADLKPVAGIGTVSEGNMVSHVQLLARNLAIPNAVLSPANLEELKQYHGQKVFYAVSNKGTVIMKPASGMNAEEKRLFEEKKRSEERIMVPADRLELDRREIIDLRDVDARHSGTLCGPKAANLGQLKKMFPAHVVEGLVIPFGIFRSHMDQAMPGAGMTYWEFLVTTFEEESALQASGASPSESEKFVLERLGQLREAIRSMPLEAGFLEDLDRSFTAVLGTGLGTLPVFLRSDTNMEDLKDFTGAGLNLTLFNVLEKEKILQGIRDVWASPYSERSYKWRQRFLLNPQYVFPSILIIPSVNVDRSGVLITKGIVSGSEDDLTVAFSRGAGGAVEGQAAESYLLTADREDILLSPSREPFYTALPATGGTKKHATTFERPLLDDARRAALRDMAEKVTLRMRELDEDHGHGPWDVELGFRGDQLWLFQIRPFVENKNAMRLEYLKNISPDIPENKTIFLKALR